MGKFRVGVGLVLWLGVSCASRPVPGPAVVLPQGSEPIADLEIPKAPAEQEVTRYSAFALAFNKEKRLADWVGYTLTPEQLNNREKSPRRNYRRDPNVKGSLQPAAFPPMPLEKGHLAPRADFAWSADAQKEADLTTNLAPQMDCVNEEVWKTIEFRVRRFARSWPKTYIVTGPVLKEDCRETVKGVCVPAKFFKVALFTSPTEVRATAFVVPNECPSKVDPREYLVSVEDVEKLTGFDFFAQLPDDAEKIVETAHWEPEVPTEKLLARERSRSLSRKGN